MYSSRGKEITWAEKIVNTVSLDVLHRESKERSIIKVDRILDEFYKDIKGLE